MKKQRIFILGIVVIAVILILAGCGKKENNEEKVEKENQNQVQSVEKTNENTVANQTNNEINKTNSTAKNTVNSNTNTTTATNNTVSTSTNNNATTPKELVVYREGMADTVASKEYTSTYGYTMRYATENFSVSNHDNCDWYEDSQGYNCVVVEKENVPYSQKVASISNFKKTSVNGYEAVYTTRRVEGQFETTYYVNSGKDSTYIITTSCQDNTEYLEGLAKIMEAMVQTFAIK